MRRLTAQSLPLQLEFPANTEPNSFDLGGRLSTVDLLVLTSFDQLFFKNYFPLLQNRQP
jgi:hypothetical protein